MTMQRFKWSFLNCLVFLSSSAYAAQGDWTPFETNIQCKTIHAKLVSNCVAIREEDEPGLCRLQTIQFLDLEKSATKKRVLLKTDRSIGMQSRYAADWRCLIGPDKQEYLDIEIFNWINTRDEAEMLFQRDGRMISKTKLKALYQDPKWEAILRDEDKSVTSRGKVKLPEYRQD